MLKEKLQSDLKAAMLSGDKQRVSVLSMLKGAILNQEIADGTRNLGLTDEQVLSVFAKESKKRSDAAAMYEQAGRTEQAQAELFEQSVIAEYLPKQLSDEEITKVINEVIQTITDPSMKQMGQVIGAVKAKLGQTADGGKIAQLVKEKLS